MSPRQPRQDAILTAEDAAYIRRALAACSLLIAWGKDNGGPQFREAVAAATEATGTSRSPSGLAYQVGLAIDYLDLAPARRDR